MFVLFLLVIVLSVLRFTASGYSCGILWPLYCLSFDLPLLVTLVVSFGHCIVCPSIYRFWLLLWYLVAIALSVLRFTSSGYSCGILWPLYCLSFDLPLLVTPVVSFSYCTVFLRFTASGYSCGILWPLYCLSFDLPLLVTPVVFFGHCIVCPSIYRFWLLLWYLLVIVLSSFDLPLLVTPVVSCGHCIVCPSIYRFWLLLWYFLVIVLSVLRFTTSGYSCGILWPLYCLSFDLPLLVTPVVSFGHYIVCPSIYRFWLLLWYLLVIVLSVLRFTASGYSCGIFWSLYCLSFDLPLLVTPKVSCGHCIVCPSIYRFWLLLWYLLVIVLSVLRFTLLVTPVVSFGHYIVCPSIYRFWLLLWYLLVIVLSVLRFTASGYSCGIFWSLYCLSFDLPLLVTPKVSCGHCIVCPSIYRFWLLLWYLQIFLTLSMRNFDTYLKRQSMGVAWVGILPRQGVLGRSTFFVVFSF